MTTEGVHSLTTTKDVGLRSLPRVVIPRNDKRGGSFPRNDSRGARLPSPRWSLRAVFRRGNPPERTLAMTTRCSVNIYQNFPVKNFYWTVAMVCDKVLGRVKFENDRKP